MIQILWTPSMLIPAMERPLDYPSMLTLARLRTLRLSILLTLNLYVGTVSFLKPDIASGMLVQTFSFQYLRDTYGIGFTADKICMARYGRIFRYFHQEKVEGKIIREGKIMTYFDQKKVKP